MAKVKQLISASTNKKAPTNKRINLSLSQRGFSLFEILIAMALLAMISYVVLSGSGAVFTKNPMDEALSGIERAARFASSETVLRSSIVRLYFEDSDENLKYKVESGPREGFILPEFEEESPFSLSLSEQAEKEKREKKLSSQFQTVKEFSSEGENLPEDINLLVFATSLQSKNFSFEGKASVYFYPNGERDNALLVIASDEELASLEILPFSDEIKRSFYDVSQIDMSNQPAVFEKAKEIYEAWLTSR